jgi:hypothetical protein
MRSKKIVLKQNSESNLTIISAKGFEGIDNYYKNASVYFLEDRGNEFETFYISNFYQAFNRVRNGASYIEYNRLDLSNKRKDDFKDINTEVNSFINAKLDHKGNAFSTENKQTKKYKKYHSFVIFEQDSNGVFSIKRNDASINLHKEKIIYDKPFPAPEFEKFLADRKIGEIIVDRPILIDTETMHRVVITEAPRCAFVTRWNNIPAIDFQSFKTKVESILRN